MRSSSTHRGDRKKVEDTSRKSISTDFPSVKPKFRLKLKNNKFTNIQGENEKNIKEY